VTAGEGVGDAATADPSDLARGLEPGHRFRCAACGNLTRFDVETVERVRRYWHVALSGAGVIEEEQRVDVAIESVTCRWCGSSDAIETVDAPASQR
jgi:hypothetical protein